jgi:hypothetical protein
MLLRIARQDNDWSVRASIDPAWSICKDHASITIAPAGADCHASTILINSENPALRVTPHPTGRTPIFYTTTDDELTIADHPRPLLNGQARLDDSTIAEYFLQRRRVSTSERTFFVGINRVPLDATFTWTPKHGVTLTSRPYPEPKLRIDDVLDEVYRALTAEIRRLDDGGRIACLLSGGIDSSLVASLTLETLPAARDRVVLLSARDLASPDEHRLQDAVARTLGLPHLAPPVTKRVSIDALRVLNRNATAPSGGLFSGVYHDLATAAAAESIGSIFGGEGGEEVFEPHPHLIADLLRRGQFACALRATAYFTSLQLAPSAPAVLYQHGILPLLGRSPRSTKGDMLLGLLGPFAEKLASRVNNRYPTKCSASTLQALHDVAAVPHYEPAWTGTVPRYVSPLVAPDVVNAAFSLHFSERLPAYGSYSKRLLRALANGRLPPEVRLAPKVGIPDLLARMTRGHEDELAAILSNGTLSSNGIIPSPALVTPANVPASASLLWVLLLLLTIWYAEVRTWTIEPPKLSTLWQYRHSS